MKRGQVVRNKHAGPLNPHRVGLLVTREIIVFPDGEYNFISEYGRDVFQVEKDVSEGFETLMELVEVVRGRTDAEVYDDE